MEDIDEAVSFHTRAVELTADGHYSKAYQFHNLGNSLLARHQRAGQTKDIEDAISAHRRAIDLTGDGHNSKPSLLRALGGSLVVRFERSGQLEDIEAAISALRDAVEATPDDHADKRFQLNEYASALFYRAEHFQVLDDIESAAAALRRAIELTPDDHPIQSHQYGNLGSLLYARYKDSGDILDIDSSISAHRRALELVREGSPNLPFYLNSLGRSLLARFELATDTTDLEDAIAALRQTVVLTPNDHPWMPSRLNNLGTSLHVRFAITGALEDLNAAIEILLQAIELSSDVDPSKPGHLSNLGDVQHSLFLQRRTQSNFDAVISSFSAGSMLKLGRPSVRLYCAVKCVALLTDITEFSSAHSLLAAHSRLLDVLPEVVWLGDDMNQRLETSALLGDFVSDAVCAAITAQELVQAIEWLEAGRALIWSQILSLRTPLDELEQSNPGLAQSLRTVQKQLLGSDRPALTADFPRKETADTNFNALAATAPAEHRRQLLITYERIVFDVRNCAGFENFLRPKTRDITSLSDSIDGYVVFINVDSTRCDALVLAPGGLTRAVALPELSKDRAMGLRSSWAQRLRECGVRLRAIGPLSYGQDNTAYLIRLLEFMWKWIVHPVLHAIGLVSTFS